MRRASPLIQLRNIPLHFFTRLLIWLVRVLPADRALAIGGSLGSFIYAIQPGWRKTALRNLELIYSHQPAHAKPTREELEIMAAQTARHLGWEVIEFMLMGLLPVEQGMAMIAEAQGKEHILEALKRGNGAIVLGMHYGNWELSGAYIAQAVAPMHAVGKAQSDSFFTELAFAWRAKYGMSNIFSGKQQGSSILRALRQNAALGLVSDQNGGKAGTFAPLFGIEASCPAGAASLAYRLGTPLFVIYCRRVAPGNLRFVCTPEIELSGLPGDQQAGTVEILRRMNLAMEQVILADPAQWLLGHKRWKTRPAGSPWLYGKSLPRL